MLSYHFAKHNGLILLSDKQASRPEDAKALVGRRSDSVPASLIEARRALGFDFALKDLTPVEFDKALSDVYTAGDFESDLGGSRLTDQMDTQESVGSFADHIPQAADLLDTNNDAPLIRLINGLIAEAVRRRGSDIHIEPFEQILSVRLRIDGLLSEVLKLPAKVAPMLTSRIKVMSRLDIAEKRIPQDGRISLTLGGKALDVRVSTLPAHHGERVVMRLLDRDQAHFSVDDLGMTPRLKKQFEDLLLEPNGIFLVTGPTGSGKTTSLYAGLTFLNDQSRNILTVEDPVEYALSGVGQTQVNNKVGMTFAAGLRAILRQDPDVVMVGEIRDKETADIAVQASLTGHLVLSTVHTNSAAAAITRLRDMAVEPFLLASTIKGIMAQRLVRRLCGACKVRVAANSSHHALLGPDCPHIYQAGGCKSCNYTGYQGRAGIYELIVMDAALSEMVHSNVSEADIKDYALRDQPTLAESGYDLVRRGVTSLEEILRVVRTKNETNPTTEGKI